MDFEDKDGTARVVAKDKPVIYTFKNKEQMHLYNKMKYSQQDRYYNAATAITVMSGFSGIILVGYGISYYFIGNTKTVNTIFRIPVLLWVAGFYCILYMALLN